MTDKIPDEFTAVWKDVKLPDNTRPVAISDPQDADYQLISSILLGEGVELHDQLSIAYVARLSDRSRLVCVSIGYAHNLASRVYDWLTRVKRSFAQVGYAVLTLLKESEADSKWAYRVVFHVTFPDIIFGSVLPAEEKEERIEEMTEQNEVIPQVEYSHIQKMLDKDYPGECVNAHEGKGSAIWQQLEAFVHNNLTAEEENADGLKRSYELMEVAKVEDHYIALIAGGNNGSPDWPAYFDELKRIFDMFPPHGFSHPWLIKWDNDSPDDVNYVYIGFREREKVA